MVKGSAKAAGLDGVLVEEGTGWLDEDAFMSSALLSGGVSGGVGKPAEVDEVAAVGRGSLAEEVRDGFLS